MSTFSCGGGSSMGYKLAGCEVAVANDIDPQMAYHYKKNLNPEHYFLCPIGDLLSKELPEVCYNLDILDGSPPCSTFSMSGKREKDWGKDKHFREGQAKQVLSDLFFDYLALVEKLKPKVAIAENVKGMLAGNAKGYTKAVMKKFTSLGYTPQVFLINSADCGVPQTRERVFFVAVRNDLNKPKLKLAPNKKWITCKAATIDLQDLTKAEQEKVKFTAAGDKKWWPLTKPGQAFKHAVIRETGKNTHFSQMKLNSRKPSCTLTATDQMYHWSVPRYLTFNEWKRLGSFPDNYEAKTDKIGKYMIGMSVPPRMTEVVARAVCEQWLDVDYGES